MLSVVRFIHANRAYHVRRDFSDAVSDPTFRQRSTELRLGFGNAESIQMSAVDLPATLTAEAITECSPPADGGSIRSRRGG
jgi:hypothetical protein